MSALLSLEPALQHPLLDLVIAAAWADPLVGDRQLAAVRGARIALGLIGREHEDVLCEGATGAWRDLARAPMRDRAIAYAAAVWTALADDLIDGGEARLLREVRHALGLDDAAVRFADGLARWVDAIAREEQLPSHRAFARLVVEGARRHARMRARIAA